MTGDDDDADDEKPVAWSPNRAAKRAMRRELAWYDLSEDDLPIKRQRIFKHGD